METLKERVMGKEVLHVPNIQDEAGVKGVLNAIDKYKARMLSPLGPNDSAIMPADTETHLQEMFRLYDDYGISHLKAENIVYVDQGPKDALSEAVLRQCQEVRMALNGSKSKQLVPFIFSEQMEKVAEGLGVSLSTSAKSSEIVNNKYLTQSELRERGVSAPPGKLVHSVAEGQAFCKKLVAQGYDEVSFKLIRAASGLGVFKIKPEEIPEYMEKFAGELRDHGILIDGWIKKEKMASPNIQYSIGDTPEEDHFISCTDQILEGNIHRGNINAPELLSLPRVKTDIVKIRDWVREVGYRGIIGVDFYIDTEETPYIMEINARVNGSTPGALLVDKLIGNTVERPWGVQNNIAVAVGSSMNDFLTRLDREKISYDPKSKLGVLLTNSTAINSHGKAMVIVLGQSNGQVREMLNTLHGL